MKREDMKHEDMKTVEITLFMFHVFHVSFGG